MSVTPLRLRIVTQAFYNFLCSKETNLEIDLKLGILKCVSFYIELMIFMCIIRSSYQLLFTIFRHENVVSFFIVVPAFRISLDL